MESFVCISCKRELPLSEFWNPKALDYDPICHDCDIQLSGELSDLDEHWDR